MSMGMAWYQVLMAEFADKQECQAYAARTAESMALRRQVAAPLPPPHLQWWRPPPPPHIYNIKGFAAAHQPLWVDTHGAYTSKTQGFVAAHKPLWVDMQGVHNVIYSA